MLAQSFLSAEDLKIPETHKQALMKVLVLLETGKLTHVSIDDKMLAWPETKIFDGLFNMNPWDEHYNCGTVACIGGTAELIGGIEFDACLFNSELAQLFAPDTGVPYNGITTNQAARALRNYLTTGKSKWGQILR